MREIIHRFEQLLWEGNIPTKDSALELYQALEPVDACDMWYWKDIDYSDQTRSFWCPVKHYERMRIILKGFGKSRLLENEYSKKMIGTLKYWLVNDFENPNWWHNQIGTPQAIGDLAIMMHPVLDKDTLSRVIALVAKGSMAKNIDITELWTGANLMWGALNTIRHALLIEDESLLRMAAERVSKEITIGMQEGIQEDYSFFQHGPRLYSGGYGRSFVYDISKILFLLNGTKYRLPNEKTELVLSFVLEGLRPMIQKNALDWSCVGREITRVDTLNVGSLKTALKILLRTADLSRKDELNSFLESINEGVQPNYTKYFHKAFMLCHHFNGIYVGAKFLTNKTFGAEICNGEGELCYNMSYGTQTCIMKNGGEYFNINPVWDYSRIPGTTSLIETDEQLLARKDWTKRPLLNEHFGGKQQGRRAVIYELAEHDGIKMMVADFAFEDGFVCLGMEIEPQCVDRAKLVSTVDQCLVQGDVVVENNSIIHNAIRYTALQDTHIESTVETKQGSWRRNNIALSEKMVSADVLTLSINHFGKNKCTYAYMISSADTPLPKVDVLQNDCALQAIRLPDGSVMAVSHQSGPLLDDDKIMICDAGTGLC